MAETKNPGVVEFYTTPGCTHCAAAREDLEWRGIEFVEYDVSVDEAARARLISMAGQRSVPAIIEPGGRVQVGWMGRGCTI